jgi:uncharacterized RDD family membrane protein YckC
VTGEAVALDLRPAAVPSRLLAGAVDAGIQLAVFFAILTVAGAVSTTVSAAATAAIAVVLILLVSVGYPVAFESLLRGRTPGKMALGLRVVRDDGGPIGFRHAFVRGLAGAFIERPGVTFFAGAIITMLLNSKGKRLGDLLAGTVVLQERVAVRGGQVAMMPPQLIGWAVTTDLSGLRDDLAMSVRQFLARSGEMTTAAREDLGNRLVTAVLAVITPAPPPGTPGWAVLSAVLAERRRREEARLGAPPPTSGWGPAPSYGPTPGYGPTPSYGPTPRYGPTPSYGARPAYGPAPAYGAAPTPTPIQPPGQPAPAQPPETGPGGFVAPS